MEKNSFKYKLNQLHTKKLRITIYRPKPNGNKIPARIFIYLLFEGSSKPYWQCGGSLYTLNLQTYSGNPGNDTF